MNNICVFCGSRPGNDDSFAKHASEFGKTLAQAEKTLVYGGGNVGLMGLIADAVMKNGGKVIGVIPDFLLQREVGHNGLTHLHVVDSMHTRKQKMAEMADAFIAMPGGFGTLEELAEILTWVQLEIMTKPVGILNINGFFDPLLLQLDTMVNHGFLKPKNRQLVLNIQSIEEVIPSLTSHATLLTKPSKNLEKT